MAEANRHGPPEYVRGGPNFRFNQPNGFGYSRGFNCADAFDGALALAAPNYDFAFELHWSRLCPRALLFVVLGPQILDRDCRRLGRLPRPHARAAAVLGDKLDARRLKDHLD